MLTIVADGCFSQFRKGLVKEKPERLSSFVAGLVTNGLAVRSDYVSIILTDRNPVVFYQNASNSTRILVDAREKTPMTDMKHYLQETICPQLPGFIEVLFVFLNLFYVCFGAILSLMVFRFLEV